MEHEIVRMFEIIDRVWSSVERDKRKSFLNYYFMLFKLVVRMEQTELLPQVSLLRTLGI